MNEIKELARTIVGTGRAISNNAIANSGFNLCLGTMTPIGIKLDNFKYEITDYMVLDYLTMDVEYFTKTNTAGTDSHSHNVITPDELMPLKTGDRVLVAQVGNETVIIGRVS